MKSLNIGVIAYGVDPSMVFVRVPNERGRWMLVDRSVVEVDCPHKLRIRADELAELQTPIREADEELVEIEPRAIAAVKKAAPMIGMWVEAEAAANGGKVHPVTSREVERVLWEDATKIKVTPR